MPTKDNDETQKIEETIELATETLSGDIRDFLLDRVKNHGKPWAAMSEKEQRDQIIQAKTAAERPVKLACNIIAAQGKRSLVGNLVKVQIKDRIQVQLDFSKLDELRRELIDAQGMNVLLVVPNAEQFIGDRGPAEPTPDQGDLIKNAEKLKKEDGKVTPLR